MFDKTKDLYQLQKKARTIKKQLKKTHIEAEHNGVTITIDGEQEIIKVDISQDAIQNKTKLEESLTKALNKGIKKSQQIGAEMMKDVMGDLNIPGM